MTTKVEVIKENEGVQDLEKFIKQHITVDDVPELFVKKNFKDETTIKSIQDSIQAGCGTHIYVSEIVEYLIKYAQKIIKNKTVKDSEDYLVKEEESANEPRVLPGIDYYDNRRDAGHYEGKFGAYDEIDLEN